MDRPKMRRAVVTIRNRANDLNRKLEGGTAFDIDIKKDINAINNALRQLMQAAGLRGPADGLSTSLSDDREDVPK